MSAYLAHVREGSLKEAHELSTHLKEVASLTAAFANDFQASEWGYLAGLWHDLGKYRLPFQNKLRATGGVDAHIQSEREKGGQRVTHSHAGALHAIKMLGKPYGSLLAFLITGHHTGLPDNEPDDGAGASLKARLEGDEAKREYAEALAETIPADILTGVLSNAKFPNGSGGFALWLRMLFSCLVDADFLDTEAFFNPDKAACRQGYPALAALKAALDAHMTTMSEQVHADGLSPVNQHRAEVLTQCRNKALLSPGFFTLTVPTGGGKTLSSLAFALDHALVHDKRRIIYAIPYTSIIEQTAKVFREVFAGLGKEIVLEHHSNLDVDERREDHANRLAADNWDAPIIVTTNVQLFESLHAARTSRCRKLHNLVNSVIVLDEAQLLPRDFLAPVLCVLKELVEYYGVTVVLCTATQPALMSRHEPITNREILPGIDNAHEIIENSAALFDALKRVQVHLPNDFRLPIQWSTLASEITSQDTALAIVNTRKQAHDLLQLLPTEGSEHLSALMCAEHRSAAIQRIKERLKAKRKGTDNQPLRVVSTQLVEAGVDLDFPVVYRALAGLDSIAQAAGRCNREGKLDGFGQVHVFVAPGNLPPGLLRQGAQTTRELAYAGKLADPLAPTTFRDYFDQLYAQGELDREGILELLKPNRAAFRTAAAKFRLIDDDAETVIVPYKKDGETESPVNMWLNVLKKDGSAAWARRKLQRYTVNVPRKIFERVVKQNDVEERAGLWVALDCRYDPVFGLLLPGDHGNPSGYFG